MNSLFENVCKFYSCNRKYLKDVSTIDAKYSLELITDTVKRLVPHAVNLLDVGCGAGNYTLVMLQKISGLNCTLLDLSKPMLDKAFERVSMQTDGVDELVRQPTLNSKFLTLTNHPFSGGKRIGFAV